MSDEKEVEEDEFDKKRAKDSDVDEEKEQGKNDEEDDDVDDKDAEAYILRVYGGSGGSSGADSSCSSSKNQLSGSHAAGGATTTTAKTTLRRSSSASLRRLSKRLSNELVRRRSSIEEIVEEVRPKTPAGWTIFLSAVATSVLGYEVNLQQSLTAPPVAFGQFHSRLGTNVGHDIGGGSSRNNGDNKMKRMATNRQMADIYAKLTSTPTSIFSRKIQPSLFVGTRGLIASTAAYMFGGPAKQSHSQQDHHVQFREVLTMTYDNAKLALDWEVPRKLLSTSSTSSSMSSVSPISSHELQKQILHGPIQQPVVLVFHGINNDANFGYMKSLRRTFANRGWAAASVNFRGAGGIPLNTPRGYNAAYTGDVRNIVLQLSSRLANNVPLFLVGNSLGANIMTKYLGEEGGSGTLPQCVAGAVSLGNPMQIHSSNVHFPFNIILGMGVKKTILENFHSLSQVNDPYWHSRIWKALLSATTIAQIDHALSPILVRNDPHPPFQTKVGYKDGVEYWYESSSYRYVSNISIPFLNIAAGDDFLVAAPSRNKIGYCISNPNVMVVETRCGGHLGWQESPPNSKNFLDFGASPWADTACADFFQAIIDVNAEQLEKQQRPPRPNNDDETSGSGFTQPIQQEGIGALPGVHSEVVEIDQDNDEPQTMLRSRL